MSDYSKPPLEVLLDNQNKGYVGIHIEQSVPILDRDLNLLNDLITATVRSVITRYIGNGIPTGMDAFNIQAIVPADNDFWIRCNSGSVGTCLVGGLEVSISTDIKYSSQAGVPILNHPVATQPNPRIDMVYLDVWLTEVDGTVDSDLLNSTDVGMQTSVRQKPAWVVRVAEGVSIPIPSPGHFHCPLAQLTRKRDNTKVEEDMITDLRQKRLMLAEIEKRTNALESILLLPAFLPSGNQFSPRVGVPGQNVTLKGRNFDIVLPDNEKPEVKFGSFNATVIGTPTSTQIVARVPTMPGGPVTITVVTGGGSITSNDDFTVLAQLPSFNASSDQFSPRTGPVGQIVNLKGNNFNIGTVQVKFGAVNATTVGIPTATQIVTVVPAGATGSVKITVTTSGGSVTSDDPFTVIPANIP